MTIVNITSTTITLTWSQVSAIDQNGVITGYEVEYTQTTFDSVPTTQNVTVNSTMAELTGLEEYVEYTIQVRAFTEEGPGPYSDAMNITTDQDSKFVEAYPQYRINILYLLLVPHTAPANLEVQNSSANSLYVVWERPREIDINGVLIRYDIDYFIEGESNSEILTVNVTGDTLMATLVDLNNYTIYSVSVYAVTIGRGPPASQVERTSENGE